MIEGVGHYILPEELRRCISLTWDRHAVVAVDRPWRGRAAGDLARALDLPVGEILGFRSNAAGIDGCLHSAGIVERGAAGGDERRAGGNSLRGQSYLRFI